MSDSLFTLVLDTLNKSSNSVSLNYVAIFLSSFGGAFFAFIFIKIAAFFKTVNQINYENYKSLIKLEFMLNQHLDEISANIFEIKEFISHVSKAVSEKFTLISPNQPKEIYFDDNIFYALRNVDMMNEVFSYKMKLKRCNSDIVALNNLKSFFMSALQQKTIEPDMYMKNLQICVKKFNLEIGALESLKNLTKHLFASVRVRKIKDRPLFLHKLNIFIIRRKNENNFSEMVESEIKKIDEEIEQVQAKSKEYISQIKETPNKSIKGN